MNEVFSRIQAQLETQGFSIVDYDHNRPWGGFFCIDQTQTQQFIDMYFQGEDVQFDENTKLSPKILIVNTGKRLSWQYHHRRSELWKVVEGPVGIVMSDTDQEGELQTYNIGQMATLPQGVRHRLVGLETIGIVAEIWQHTNPTDPSNEDDIIRLQDDFGRES